MGGCAIVRSWGAKSHGCKQQWRYNRQDHFVSVFLAPLSNTESDVFCSKFQYVSSYKPCARLGKSRGLGLSARARLGGATRPLSLWSFGKSTVQGSQAPFLHCRGLIEELFSELLWLFMWFSCWWDSFNKTAMRSSGMVGQEWKSRQLALTIH